MSDHWEIFPCTMGDHEAFITYDHGIRTEIESLPFANCARYEVTLRDPDDRGLPRGEEFDALNKVEDRISDGLGPDSCVSVGRVTTNGRRYLYFYTMLEEPAADRVGQTAAAECGFDISLLHRHDPEKNGYWKELFPTADDWQVIQDMRVEDSLRKAGDTLEKPRPITHWAYFPHAADRQKFLDAVGDGFESIDLYETPDCDRGIHTARLTHSGLPDHRSMNATTSLLNREATRAGGDYDGWETGVVKG